MTSEPKPFYPEPSSPYITDEAGLLHDIRELLAELVEQGREHVRDGDCGPPRSWDMKTEAERAAYAAGFINGVNHPRREGN